MCGIVGQFSDRLDDKEDFVDRQNSLQHRGPDSSGIFVSADKKLKLGHQRLAVLDLSDRAGQPMSKNSCQIVYNGEVYNFQELRKDLELKGYKFDSNSDTEVVLAVYLEYGLAAFEKLDGMFALAIYDSRSQQLILARDRMGIKPLYYHWDNKSFYFASEIQALPVGKNINLKSVQKFLQQNYVYGPETILENVFQLPAAHLAVYDINTNSLDTKKYWQADFDNKNNNISTAVGDLKDVLSASVKQSMISDVPLGVFLSSGVDSSLIAALGKEYNQQVDTFTVGFEFDSFDESKDSAKIAEILGVNHHSINLNKQEVIDKIPEILDLFHEPFGDSSAIPMYFLARFAREKVKVCLSGDGADELFGGYPIYYLPRISNIYRYMPFKSLLERGVAKMPSSSDKMSLDYKLRRFVHAAKHDYKRAHFYYRAMHNQGVLTDNFGASESFDTYFKNVADQNTLNQLLYVDQQTVLEGDYLVKVDRTSMAHSLEVRVPFLNNAVIDFANQLHPKLKIKGTTTKYVLKKLLEQYLPKDLIYTEKKGFAFPIADWLRQELKDFMLESLAREKVEKISFLNYSKVEELIKDHLKGSRDYNRELWGLISLVRYLSKKS